MGPPTHLINITIFNQYFKRLPSNVRRLYSRKTNTQKITTLKRERPLPQHILDYFNAHPHIQEVQPLIPNQYLTSRSGSSKHLYLVDKNIAEDAVKYIIPFLLDYRGRICETNAGLALISSELLLKDIKLVHLYESCNEFREKLELKYRYQDNVRLYSKDLFRSYNVSYVDRINQSDHIHDLFEGSSRTKWENDPAMTIIGPMPNLLFIKYLTRMVAYQSEIISYGRVQIFAFMKSTHYSMLLAKAGDTSPRYKPMSILFQLLFDSKVMSEYPRKAFLPWDSEAVSKVDGDTMFLIHIKCKKHLPTDLDNLIYLYYFVIQGFGRGKNKVVATLEAWFPGIGLKLVASQEPTKFSHPNMSIFTEFRQLSPKQILETFLISLQEPNFKTSPFLALVSSLAMRSESIVQDEKKRK